MPSLTSSQKIFVAFGAVVVFFLAAWMLYKPSGMLGTNPSATPSIPPIAILENAPDDSARWTEDYVGSGQANADFRASSTRPVDSSNLSESLARNMSDEFRSRFIDPTISDAERQKLFKQLQDGTFEDAPDFSEYMSADKTGIVDYISKKELRVASDDSEQARHDFLVNYLNGIEPLRNENANEFIAAFNEVVKSHDVSSINEMIGRYQRVYEAVSKLSTPPSMQDLQARTLVFLKNALTMFTALRGFDTDPLRAYSALQHFDSLQGEWAAIAQKITSLTQ
jgi:hypothetical protein